MFWRKNKKIDEERISKGQLSEQYVKYRSDGEAFLRSMDYLNAWYNFLKACVEKENDSYCEEKREESKKLLSRFLADKYGEEVAKGFEESNIVVGMPKDLSVKMCGKLTEKNDSIEYYDTLYSYKLKGFKRWKVDYDENNHVKSVKLLRT